MSFYPGQRVVCVDDSQQIIGGLVKGRVYTVRDYFIVSSAPWEQTAWGKGAIRVFEFRYGCACGVEDAHDAARFRPVDESRLDVFRQHLVNPPKEEELA